MEPWPKSTWVSLCAGVCAHAYRLRMASRSPVYTCVDLCQGLCGADMRACGFWRRPVWIWAASRSRLQGIEQKAKSKKKKVGLNSSTSLSRSKWGVCGAASYTVQLQVYSEDSTLVSWKTKEQIFGLGNLSLALPPWNDLKMDPGSKVKLLINMCKWISFNLESHFNWYHVSYSWTKTHKKWCIMINVSGGNCSKNKKFALLWHLINSNYKSRNQQLISKKSKKISQVEWTCRISRTDIFKISVSHEQLILSNQAD